MPHLSHQRVTVLVGLANGKSTTEIAKAMSVTNGTVKSHIAYIFKGLNVNDRPHAVGMGIRLGLIVPEQVVLPGECPGTRTDPNWCACECDSCKANRCDLHGGMVLRLKMLGEDPSYYCFRGRHTACSTRKCTCKCGHTPVKEDE